MDRRVTELVALVVTVASVASAGCGGGGHASSTPASRSTSTTAARSGGSPAVSAGPVRASLAAANHAPRQGKEWPYRVRVSDAAGRPLSGTVEIQFVFGGQVVGRDTPRTHPVTHGTWHDRLVFPPASVGQPLTVRAVVHTSQGSVTLDWPIKVTA
jgi:hypothetical protein